MMIETERAYRMRRWIFMGILGAMLLFGCGLPALGLSVWALSAGEGQDDTQAAPTLIDANAIENASQGQGNQAGPVEPLGYATEAEAKANCDTGRVIEADYQGWRTVEPIYRRYQIVGWSCNVEIR